MSIQHGMSTSYKLSVYCMNIMNNHVHSATTEKGKGERNDQEKKKKHHMV